MIISHLYINKALRRSSSDGRKGVETVINVNIQSRDSLGRRLGERDDPRHNLHVTAQWFLSPVLRFLLNLFINDLH